MFFKGSRYEFVPDAMITDGFGRTLRYKRVRFIPQTRAFVGHRVVQGERLDHMANEHYRDPERFWRLCDANRALWPNDLLEIGRVLKVPPSEG